MAWTVRASMHFMKFYIVMLNTQTAEFFIFWSIHFHAILLQVTAFVHCDKVFVHSNFGTFSGYHWLEQVEYIDFRQDFITENKNIFNRRFSI